MDLPRSDRPVARLTPSKRRSPSMAHSVSCHNQPRASTIGFCITTDLMLWPCADLSHLPLDVFQRGGRSEKLRTVVEDFILTTNCSSRARAACTHDLGQRIVQAIDLSPVDARRLTDILDGAMTLHDGQSVYMSECYQGRPENRFFEVPDSID